MSGMTLGGMLEADRRVRDYEFVVRAAKKRKADEAVWKRWEGLVSEERAVEEEGKRRGKGG